MATPLNEKASDDKDAPCPYRYDLVFNAVDPKLEVGCVKGMPRVGTARTGTIFALDGLGPGWRLMAGCRIIVRCRFVRRRVGPWLPSDV